MARSRQHSNSGAFNTTDLDMWLAFEPGTCKCSIEAYQQVRDRLGVFKWIRLHALDAE